MEAPGSGWAAVRKAGRRPFVGCRGLHDDLHGPDGSLRTAPDIGDAGIVSACAEAFDEEAGSSDLAELVLRIHRRLFERARDNMVSANAGSFKTVPSFTRDPNSAGSFGYTSPGSVAEAIGEWQEFTLATDPTKPELVRQILSHWMFEHIHPVTDGNGRIGRLLVPIIMMKKGKTRSACAFFGEAVHENKDLYIDSLKDARIGADAKTYTRQMLGFVMTTARRNVERMQKLAEIEAEWKGRITARSDSMVRKLIPYAVTKPVFTIADAQREIGASFASINIAVGTLVRAGILSVPDGVRRDRLFHANDVLDIFDRFRPGLSAERERRREPS